MTVIAVAIAASVTTVMIDAQKSATPAATTSQKKIVPVDLNTADAKALADVPGVGEKLAALIIKARPFKSVDDLKKITGIGEGKKFDTLKPYFTVGSTPGSVAPKAKSTTPTLAPGEKININTATAEQLIKLPDVGATKAKAIIDYRTKHGPFAKIEDVMKVEGIKEGVFAKIKNSIVVR